MAEGQPPSPPQRSLPPVSQPFPGSLTPGWNDPPSIQYNPSTSGTPGRTKLNKRVPFPLQQSNTTKPTAIVQPCQGPMHAMGMGQQTTGIPSNSCNIAVVHPLQHASSETTATSILLPPATIAKESSSQNIIQTHSDIAAPSMFVPAVPRHPEAAAESTVQHL